MSTESDKDRSVKAHAILTSQLYIESWEMCRAAIIERIEKCSLTDTQTAEDLRRCLKLLRDVRLNLEAAVNVGKLADFKIAQQEKIKANPFRGLFR